MNLVGKIFVVLIFVFSLVFMTSAILTYATHRNWRDAVLNPQTGFKQKLTQAETRYKELEGVRQRLETELANERVSRQRAVAALVQETTDLNRRADQLAKQEAALKADTARAVAAMEATQATLAKLRNEIEGLRTDIETARTERDDNFNKAVKFEDQLAQKTGELDRLNKQNQTLVADLSKYQLALQDANIQLDRDGPPRLDGVVLASRNTGYVEISLGSDDGLEKGHELDVYRVGPTAAENKYLGKVRVVETEPDKSVAQILPNFKRGTIQKEDRVATRLQ
jgi:predicted  nucleic acid-binding Zn-ribbon protein